MSLSQDVMMEQESTTVPESTGVVGGLASDPHKVNKTRTLTDIRRRISIGLASDRYKVDKTMTLTDIRRRISTSKRKEPPYRNKICVIANEGKKCEGLVKNNRCLDLNTILKD